MRWGNGDGITLEQMETQTHFYSLFSSPVKENDHLAMKCLRQTVSEGPGVCGWRETVGGGRGRKQDCVYGGRTHAVLMKINPPLLVISLIVAKEIHNPMQFV